MCSKIIFTGGTYMDEELLNKLSDILSEKNIDLNQIINSAQDSNIHENSSNSNKESSNIDTDTILKFQKLAGLLSHNESSKDETLLKALKPYMRNSRKEKIDQYIKMLHIINMLEKFQEMGGNINDIL